MRKPLVVFLVVLATLATAVPALARERTWHVDVKRMDFGTLTRDASGNAEAYSTEIRVTNISDRPLEWVPLSFEMTKPKNAAFTPFLVEDQGLMGVPVDHCADAPLEPGQYCGIYLQFSSSTPGTYTAWLWIDDRYRVKLIAVVV
jgi:hypothetical protein